MAVEALCSPSSELCTVPNSESPEPDVEPSCLQKKKKKCKLESNGESPESPSLQSQVAQLSDQEAPQREENAIITDSGSPQSNVELSLSKEKRKKKKKKKKKKGCETSETNDTSYESPSLQPQPVQLSGQQAPMILTDRITTITDPESPQSYMELSHSQNKKKKKKKKKGFETSETNDKSCGDQKEEIQRPSEAVQPQLVQVMDQKLEVPQPLKDLSFSVRSKKRNGKTSRKPLDCKDEVCGVSVSASVMESNIPTVDPCKQPSVEISLEQLVAEPLGEGIIATINSESPKLNADFCCSLKTKKNKRKKSHEDKELSVETMMPEDPPFHPSLAKVSEQESDVSQPLNADFNSESSRPNADFTCPQETTKKKRKRGSKTSDSKEMLVEVMKAEADSSPQPLLAIFSGDELEVPQQLNTDAEPLVGGMSTTIHSESTRRNEDLSCSQKTNKKKRKRGSKTNNDKELLVEVMKPEADSSLQPLLAIFSAHELEVPPPPNTDAEPHMEGMSVTKNSESLEPNADISCAQATKKKDLRKKRKTSQSGKLSPVADPSIQPTLSEKGLEVPQPLNADAETHLEGMSITMNSNCPKANADVSCPQETKKKHQKRRRETSDSKELLLEAMTLEADPSFRPTLSKKELEVPQPLNTGAEPLMVDGMSTMIDSERPMANADFSSPQETKKRNRKKRRKIKETNELSMEIMTAEADPSVQPSLSHLSPKSETEVVAIGGQGILQMSNSSPERSLLNCSKKKLLILDINGLLADIVQMEAQIPKGFKPHKVISRKKVFKRPYCDDFLQFCFDKFNVGVWSSRTKKNVDLVIDFLMGNSKHKLLFCWNQSHCTSTEFKTVENKKKPLVLKEIRKLWENLEPDLPWARGVYNESNTVLVDDSPYKALRNPVNTAIFPFPYQFRNKKDRSLGPGGDIRTYLEGLARAENAQKYVEQNPFGQKSITNSNPNWGLYRRVIEGEDDS